MFFLSHSIVVRNSSSAFGLIVKQVPSTVFTSWRKIVFIVIDRTIFAMINHFLIAFHIRSSSGVFNLLREVSTFIMFKQTFFIPVGNMLKRRPDIYSLDVTNSLLQHKCFCDFFAVCPIYKCSNVTDILFYSDRAFFFLN